MNEKIKHTLSLLPNAPGVYIMKDIHGEIIYIGKAKILKNRVSSYFQNTKKNIKTTMLVSNIDSIEYILVASELDAFSLESNLIKEHKPKYNILLKDDKMFPYIRIDKKELFPQIQIVRKVSDDGALYFGPYVTGLRVNDFLAIIKAVYPIRQCKINFDKSKYTKRQCLYGDMGRCLCPCQGKVSNQEYLKIIDEIINFLNGENGKVRKLLIDKMYQASDKEDFEKAIEFRDLVEMLKRSEENILTSLPKSANIDCFTIGSKDDLVAINQVVIRNGKTIVDKNILLDDVDDGENDDKLLKFLTQYYDTNSAPNELLTNIELGEKWQIFSQYCRKKFQISVPSRGIKKKIVDMSLANIDEFLNKNLGAILRKQELNQSGLAKLASELNLASIPYRIECYDISNISGTNNVAGMIVFENGVASKKEYRKFKIKSVDGADDFACMKETLLRRFQRLQAGDKNFSKMPDLIVVDGGLGQLSSVREIVEGLGYDVPIIALAKKLETVYSSNFPEGLVMDENNSARKLLVRIRDEAHRFAILFHREVRDKDFLSKKSDVRKDRK